MGEESKNKNWGVSQDSNMTNEQLQLGCMLRIADATESMAQNYTEMERDLKHFKERCASKNVEIQSLNNTIRSMKGVITKLKKKK
jgi:septal ring factor EnvC (AmiA/AmiB activator)